MSEQQLDCALDLMRRLPPQQIEKNLSDLIDLGESFGCLVEQSCLIAWLSSCLVERSSCLVEWSGCLV